MGWVQGRWVGTVNEEMASLTSGLYGEEYDNLHNDLLDLVEAVRREAAHKVRDWAQTLGTGPYTAGIEAVLAEAANQVSTDLRKG